MNTGVAIDKNVLGSSCLVLGLFFFWHFLETRRCERSRARRNELILSFAFLCMIFWLLWKANSATSFVAFVLGALVMTLLGRRFVNRRRIGTYALAAMVFITIAELNFGLFSGLLKLVGQNP